ncbi:MAG: type II toxin-antitoxin system PemK/MazF family toxin [Terriglobia bacterium]
MRKTRPCLIASASLVNQHRRTAIVIPLSSSPSASPPLLVPIICAGKAAVAVIDQVRAVAKERFVERMGPVTAADMAAIESGLRQVLEL